MLVDETLLPLWEQVRPHVSVPTTIVVGATKPVPDGFLEYEALLAGSAPATDLPEPGENDAVAMCYTTGTTGAPKGVLYSHRALVLHTFGLSMRSVHGHIAKPTSCCRSSRCSTPTRGACPSRR